MADPGNQNTEVLISGAGPTGLVLALWLTRQGVRPRIVDKVSQPVTTSRAVAVQARTLEFYAQMGFAQEVVSAGRWVTGGTIWVKGKPAARIEFQNMGVGISAFEYPLIYPQDEHERLLIAHLGTLGVRVERQTEVVRFSEAGDHVEATLRDADGRETVCRAAYVAGCDGARSTIREGLGIGFPGGTYEHMFYVADVQANGDVVNNNVNIAFEPNDFLVVFPMKGEGRARFIGTVREEQADEKKLSWEDVHQGIVKDLSTEVERVNWFSTYRVHHRVAAQFRSGRCFLLGDAAHIHSPVGGQGMNTGIGDAVNLAWKLAAVLQGRARAELLDSYEPERIAFARRLVATTDRGFTTATSDGGFARLVRMRILPLLAPLLFTSRRLRGLLFRTISQVNVNYRNSGLSRGRAGRVRGGDRLPWIKPEGTGGASNFVALQSMDWQIHVYGEATQTLRVLSAEQRMPLHVFAWSASMEQAGLRRDAVYLVRPDGYVAVATKGDDTQALRSYLAEQALSAKVVSPLRNQ